LGLKTHILLFTAQAGIGQLVETINIQQRLLDNLDILDKSVAKTALLLFSTSLIYLALYYGLSDTFRIPLIDIELKKTHPYHIGIPIIFFLFQYTLVTSMAILRVEDSLSEIRNDNGTKFDPMDHTLRFPTIFAMLFILGIGCKTWKHRMLHVLQSIIVILFYYGVPLAVCVHILAWLIKNSDNGYSVLIAGVCFSICVIEVIYASVYAILRLVKFSKKPQPVSSADAVERG